MTKDTLRLKRDYRLSSPKTHESLNKKEVPKFSPGTEKTHSNTHDLTSYLLRFVLSACPPKRKISSTICLPCLKWQERSTLKSKVFRDEIPCSLRHTSRTFRSNCVVGPPRTSCNRPHATEAFGRELYRCGGCRGCDFCKPKKKNQQKR